MVWIISIMCLEATGLIAQFIGKEKCGICNSDKHNSEEHTDKLMMSEKNRKAKCKQD